MHLGPNELCPPRERMSCVVTVAPRGRGRLVALRSLGAENILDPAIPKAMMWKQHAHRAFAVRRSIHFSCIDCLESSRIPAWLSACLDFKTRSQACEHRTQRILSLTHYAHDSHTHHFSSHRFCLGHSLSHPTTPCWSSRVRTFADNRYYGNRQYYQRIASAVQL